MLFSVGAFLVRVACFVLSVTNCSLFVLVAAAVSVLAVRSFAGVAVSGRVSVASSLL